MRGAVRWLGVCLLALGLASGAAGPAEAQVRVRAEAFSGDPFGVGKLEIELPETLLPVPLGADGIGLEEQAGRVCYPAIEAQRLPRIVRDTLAGTRRPALRLLGEMIDRPGRINVYFLFRGNEPLRLGVLSQRRDALVVVPAIQARAHRRLLSAWWKQYTAAAPFWQQQPDYPPLVENYLQAMLASRLGLPLPRKPDAESWLDMLADELGLLAGSEPARLAYQRQRLAGRQTVSQQATLPLPIPIDPGQSAVPALRDKVEIEPLARRVPQECFYVRFGSFPNFLWFQDTLARWGGDLQNLVARRGLDSGARGRFEEQLGLQTTALARLLGGVVVADVAIIGTDLFLNEGGAFGILFQAKQPSVLANDLAQQRRQRLRRDSGVTEEHHLIGGREVSLVTSSDGRLRSFYVADGEFHFVTTSRWLARRFLEVREGRGSLAESAEFRHARSLLPLSRQDAVFVYLSSAFFRNLMSPGYRIEMIRRMQATADIELAQLALRAAAAEGHPARHLEALAAAGFLPPDFGQRPDGSRTVLEDSGEARDAVRGPRGYFVPVPDMELSAVTPEEAEAYARFARFSGEHWRRIDPIMVGIQRRSLDGQRERITLDLRMSPFARENYERLMQSLGPPADKHLAPVPGDSIAAEAVLRKARLFGGLQFVAPTWEPPRGPISLIERLRQVVVGYLGTTGELGWLERLNRYLEKAPPDAGGYAQGRFGLWRRQTADFTVFSFHRDVLEEVTSQLRWIEAPRPAQLWIRAADLSNARLTPFLNQWGYQRTCETSLGNLRLLHQMSQQLHVPGPEARAAAESLLGARLVDPLGGQYVYRSQAGRPGYWTTTALENAPDGASSPPVGYRAPPLDWFRGLSLDATLEPAGLRAHVELDMEMPTK